VSPSSSRFALVVVLEVWPVGRGGAGGDHGSKEKLQEGREMDDGGRS
jgi:hypothetical protein